MEKQNDVEKTKKGFHPLHKYIAFLERHSFSRRVGIIPFITIVILLAMLVVGLSHSGRIGEMTSRTVQLGLRNIGQLVTQEGFFTSVGTIKDSRELFGITVPFTERQCVYSYDGVVKAGIDFQNIEVNIDEVGKVVTVKMPMVQIYDVYINDDSLVVYLETKNVVNPMKLEVLSESKVKMKEDVKETAIANGILDNAKNNAEIMVSGFIQGMLTQENYSIQFDWAE